MTARSGVMLAIVGVCALVVIVVAFGVGQVFGVVASVVVIPAAIVAAVVLTR